MPASNLAQTRTLRHRLRQKGSILASDPKRAATDTHRALATALPPPKAAPCARSCDRHPAQDGPAPAAMFEQQPREPPRIFKSPPAGPGSTGPYWDVIRKARSPAAPTAPAQPQPLRQAPSPPPRVQVANMKWGTVYTLLVVGGAGIMAADMVRRGGLLAGCGQATPRACHPCKARIACQHLHLRPASASLQAAEYMIDSIQRRMDGADSSSGGKVSGCRERSVRLPAATVVGSSQWCLRLWTAAPQLIPHPAGLCAGAVSPPSRFPLSLGSLNGSEARPPSKATPCGSNSPRAPRRGCLQPRHGPCHMAGPGARSSCQGAGVEQAGGRRIGSSGQCRSRRQEVQHAASPSVPPSMPANAAGAAGRPGKRGGAKEGALRRIPSPSLEGALPCSEERELPRAQGCRRLVSAGSSITATTPMPGLLGRACVQTPGAARRRIWVA